jgi:hypothetical protein
MAGPGNEHDWQMEEPDVADYDDLALTAAAPEAEQAPAPTAPSAEDIRLQEVELSAKPPAEWDARRQDRELAQARAEISDLGEKRATTTPSLDGEGLDHELVRARDARQELDAREMTTVVEAASEKRLVVEQAQVRAETARAMEGPVMEIGW